MAIQSNGLQISEFLLVVELTRKGLLRNQSGEKSNLNVDMLIDVLMIVLMTLLSKLLPFFLY